jgi:hypothetical protein
MKNAQLIGGKKWNKGASAAPREQASPASVVATLAGFDESGRPLVSMPGDAGGDPVPARQTCALGLADVGREAVLTFENGDPTRPIILGILQAPQPVGSPSVRRSPDGSRLEITAGEEIVFQCGKASIMLTRAGKILLRGAYLLSRSSGVNRIKGGSVQIN